MPVIGFALYSVSMLYRIVVAHLKKSNNMVADVWFFLIVVLCMELMDS